MCATVCNCLSPLRLLYRIPQTVRLEQRKCTFSQFWRLTVQVQGAFRTGFWEASLPGCRQLAASSLGPCMVFSSVRTERVGSGTSFPSYKDSSLRGLGPHPMTTLHLLTSIQTPSPNMLRGKAST